MVYAMQEFFDTFNAYVMSHPEVLNVMEMLFRVSLWVLLGLMSLFIYFMWADRRKYLAKQRRKEMILGKDKDHFVA